MTTTRRGLDGKSYPAVRLSRQERGQAIRAAHELVHRDGLSIKAAQRAMAERYGLRRSVGIIARDLMDFECPDCTDVSA